MRDDQADKMIKLLERIAQSLESGITNRQLGEITSTILATGNSIKTAVETAVESAGASIETAVFSARGSIREGIESVGDSIEATIKSRPLG